MICSACNSEIPTDSSFFALFWEPIEGQADHSQFRIVTGCEHHPIPRIEEACALLGSGGCLLVYLADFLREGS